MALMNWAIDVPQKLLQSDAKPFKFIYNFMLGQATQGQARDK